MPSKWIGCIHKGQVGKTWRQREKAYRYDPGSSRVMPEDQNTTCSCRLHSGRNQPKKIDHVLSSELDYLQRAREQDNS